MRGRLRLELPVLAAPLPGWDALEDRPAEGRAAGPRTIDVDLGKSAAILKARP